MTTSITTRAGKGSPLTHDEVDANFTNLQTTADAALPLAGGTLTGPVTMTGGTVTTSTPLIDATQTWNAAGVTFTGWKLNITNTASATGSVLLDLQSGGQSKFSVKAESSHSAFAYIGLCVNYSSNFVISAREFGGNGGVEIQDISGIYGVRGLRSGFALIDGTNASVVKVTVKGSSSQTANLQDWTDSSNTVLASVDKSGVISGSYVKTPSTTVASLVSAATAGAGARAFVTDATATTFLSTVAGGGSNKVPVVSDGTNWLIG